MSPTFGDKNKRAASGGGQFEMYLKGFKDPLTRITILEDDPSSWFDYKEHYDRTLGAKGLFFPCITYEGDAGCLGCNANVEHPEYEDLETYFPGKTKGEAKQARKKADPGWGTRDASSKWVFPAISPDGYVNLYKIGFNLWEHFKNQFDMLGSVTASEFAVKRSGDSFNNTNYTPAAVPGELRTPKSGVTIPDHKAISAILGRSYRKAEEAYGVEVDDNVSDVQPDPAPSPEPTGDLAADQLAARRAQAAAHGNAPTIPHTTPEPGTSPAHGFVPREASVGEIKDWLSSLEPPVEFAPKAPRQDLVVLAEKTMTERSIASF